MHIFHTDHSMARFVQGSIDKAASNHGGFRAASFGTRLRRAARLERGVRRSVFDYFER